MKRFFFSLIALAAVATGCTQSAMLETPEHLGTEISFNPYTGRTPETKATQITTADALATAGGFYVYGFLNQEGKEQSVYINDEKVTKGTSGWTYNNVVYWPDASSTSTLDFVAYSANANDKTSKHSGLSKVSKTGFTFTVPDAVNDQVDLLATAYYDGKSLKTSTANVTLEFRHLLSRVSFKVETSTNKNIVVSSLSLAGKMPTEGELVFADAKDSEDKTPALTPTNKVDKEYFYYSNTTGATVTGANTSAQRIPGTEDKYLMIIPHDALEATDGLGSDHYVNITYQIGSSSAPVREASVRLPIGFEFAKGMAYEIILKISTSSISFDITEEDWNTTDKEIGPLEPDVEEEEEIVLETISDSNGRIEASTADVGQNSANINFIVSEVTPDQSWGYDAYVGIAYKKEGDSGWTHINSKNEKGTHIVQLTNLTSNTVYEYTIFVDQYGTLSGHHHYTYSSSSLTFTTLTPLPDPSVITETVLTMDDIADADLTATTAQIKGSGVLGTVDDKNINIKEYGFCWMIGEGTPTTTHDKVNNITDPTITGNLEDFTFTLSNLKPNTKYSICAYVITDGPTYANVAVDGMDFTENIVIIPANTSIYSPVRTFQTKVTVDDSETGDDTV